MAIRTRFLITLLPLLAGWLLLARAQPADPTVKIGDRIGNFTFKDIRYLPRSLDDFKDRKAFVLVFTNTTCPLVQRYLPTLQRLEKEYREKGVQFLAVNVGDDGILDLATQMVEHAMEFPFVKDFDGSVARALGVQRTPEVAVLDAERRLRYRGRIDDQYRLGGTRATPTRHDLQEALKAVLAGRDVQVTETPVDGCLITFPEPKPPATPVTYAEHVAPLLQKHCQECHRPNTAAPFSLLTYEQAAGRARTIAEVVRDQRMPPWYASPKHGTFVNQRLLTSQERQTIGDWVRGGKLRGDESKLPKSPWADKPLVEWAIEEPDLVLPVAEHEVPAEGEIPYKYVILPHVFTQDTWIQQLQIRPDNPRVLHHANIVYVIPTEGFKISNFITGMVPNGEPMWVEKGTAFRIPKGSVLGMQVHYVSTGKPEKCKITVGIRYARGTVQKQLRNILLVNHKYEIPPLAPAHPVSASKVLDRDVTGIALFSHMHLRGRDQTFRAHYPDGTTETLLVVPNYNFDWQMPYRWAPDTKRFPKGTRLECLAHYDNSAFNPFNPDPTSPVRDGLQTREEMMNGFLFYTGADEQLGLEVDPKTGQVVKEASKQ